jgi:glycosyltransferase involved in cell wall biosynthesis
MRIALLAPPDLTVNSGSTVYARAQAESLADHGLEVHVLASRPVPLRGVEVHTAAVPIPHPIEEDLTTPPERYASSVSVLVSGLLDLHARRPLSVVHAFYSTFTGCAACLFQALTGVPAVVSCFGRDVNPGMSSHPIGARLSEITVRSADRVIASNPSTATHVARLRDCELGSIPVVGMGVDERTFDPGIASRAEARAELGLDSDAVIVAAVLSSMLPEKQADVLVRGMAPVLSDRPDAKLLLVGSDYDGGTGSAELVRAAVAAAATGDSITFTGVQPHDRVALLLAAVDVFVDARRVDNFSSSLMEAVAMERAVAVSRSALRQLGGDDRFPAFDDRDTAALGRALAPLLDDPKRREQVAAAARDWWAAHRGTYSLAATTARLVELYAEAARS